MKARILSLALALGMCACSDGTGAGGAGGESEASDTALGSDGSGAAQDTGSNQAADGGADSGKTTDASEGDAGGVGRVWVPGDRVLSGGAFFFDAKGVGAVEQQMAVTAAEVYLLEYPEVRQPVAEDGSYAFEGLSAGEYTVALVHEKYYPSLSPTVTVADADVSGVNFQAVTYTIAAVLAGMVGANPKDPKQCQMVVTVTAMGKHQGVVWAPGEPGATVTVHPAVPAAQGPFYFNESVLPDKSLSATTTDGGVIVAGAKPGTYSWTAHKDGLKFNTLKLKCVGGWLTNGAPPFGLQASLDGP